MSARARTAINSRPSSWVSRNSSVAVAQIYLRRLQHPLFSGYVCVWALRNPFRNYTGCLLNSALGASSFVITHLVPRACITNLPPARHYFLIYARWKIRVVCVRVRFFLRLPRLHSYSRTCERIFPSSCNLWQTEAIFSFPSVSPWKWERYGTVQISLVSGGAALGGKILDRILALQLFANSQSFVLSARRGGNGGGVGGEGNLVYLPTTFIKLQQIEIDLTERAARASANNILRLCEYFALGVESARDKFHD